jgi:hypothetical protein
MTRIPTETAWARPGGDIRRHARIAGLVPIH